MTRETSRMQLPDAWKPSIAKIELLVKDAEEKGGGESGNLSQGVRRQPLM